MIIIDYKDRRPIYEQIVDRFEDLIAKGILQENDQLPSVRQLAVDLSINPNTIQRAYAELERRGFSYSAKGKGSFVAKNDHLLEFKREQLLSQLDDLAETARILKIPKQVLEERIAKIYESGGELA